MRSISVFLILVMMFQTFWIPAQSVPIKVDLAVKGPAAEFRSEMVISDDGAVFYIRNNEVMLDDGIATGVKPGQAFFDKGTLDGFIEPAISYVEGSPRSTLIHGQVDNVDSLSVVDFSNITAGGKLVDPRLIQLLFFTVLAASLPTVGGTPFFQPTIGAFLINGLAGDPTFTALTIFALWGFFGAPGLANMIFGGEISGTPIGPLVYTVAGLLIATAVLFNPFLTAQMNIRSNYIMTAIAVSAILNSNLIPPEIAFIGIVTKILHGGAGFTIVRTLTAAILLTYLIGFPGLASPLQRFGLNEIFEIRQAYLHLILLTGIVGLTPNALQMVLWAATASGVPQAQKGLDRGPGFDADFDNSGTVDEIDFEHFVQCYTGPNPGTPLDVACRNADLDGDGDVDHLDFNLFIEQYETPEFSAPTAAKNAESKGTLTFDPELQNTGLAIPILTQGDPVPGHPDLTISFFFTTQAGGAGTAVIGAGAVDGSLNLVSVIVVVDPDGTICALRTGQDLGDGPVTSIDSVSNVNGIGQFLISTTLESGERAIYKYTPPSATVENAVDPSWSNY